MISEKSAVLWSTRCYAALLSLYPFEFRMRFAAEMTLFFRDSCREHGIAAVWLRAIMDLALSIPLEQGRALLSVKDLQARTSGVIDSIVILAIIVFHLLAGGTGIAMSIPRSSDSFFLIAAASGAALGALGVVCSLVLARFRKVHYRYIEL